MKVKIIFKSGILRGNFHVIPAIRITYDKHKITPGFAIELQLGIWAIGWNFYTIKKDTQ